MRHQGRLTARSSMIRNWGRLRPRSGLGTLSAAGSAIVAAGAKACYKSSQTETGPGERGSWWVHRRVKDQGTTPAGPSLRPYAWRLRRG